MGLGAPDLPCGFIFEEVLLFHVMLTPGWGIMAG